MTTTEHSQAIQISRISLRHWLRVLIADQTLPLLIIVLLGTALRLYLISVNQLDPRFSDADDGDYYRRALRLVITGAYVDDAWLIRPPGHVFFFAIWIWLAFALGVPHLSVLFVQLAQVGLGIVTILLAYGVAQRLFADRRTQPWTLNHRAGLLFAGFVACWFSYIEMPTVLFSEQLFLTLFLLHLWWLLKYEQHNQLRYAAYSGLALGAAALTRSPALYSLAFVAIWLVVRQWQAHPAPRTNLLQAMLGPRQIVLRALILLSLATILIVGPWTIRNYLTYQRLIPVDTLGQINLWLDLDRVDQRTPNIETLRKLPQADRAAYALAQARQLLAENPMLPFDGMWETFRHIWKAQFIEDYYVKQSLFARPLREAQSLGLASDLLWLIFIISGIISLSGRIREGWHHRLFFFAWLGYSILTVLVFHVEPRYLIPIWTLIALYGAGGLSQLWSYLSTPATRQPWKPTVVMLIPASFTLLFCWLFFSYRDYPAIISRGIAREQAAIAADQAYQAGNYQLAEAAYRQALTIHPEFIDTRVGLALALAAQQRYPEALALFDGPNGRNLSRRGTATLGSLLRDTQQLDQARSVFRLSERTAGEDIQHWAIAWFRPPTTSHIVVGSGLELGYLAGFSPAEGPPEARFRWLEGQGDLRLPLATPIQPGQSLSLRISGGLNPLTPLSIRFANGTTQQLTIPQGTWRRYIIPIPAELVGQSILNLHLSAPVVVPAQRDPQADDSRSLSVMISDILVR